jgi:hypothetical protein
MDTAPGVEKGEFSAVKRRRESIEQAERKSKSSCALAAPLPKRVPEWFIYVFSVLFIM